MKYLILALSLFVSPIAYSFDITKDQISFEYQPTELPAVKCTHGEKNPHTKDWTVKCPFFNTVKEFNVHLIVRRFDRTEKPVHRYEVLYWITNRIEDRPVREYTGTTIWFNFENITVPHSLRMGQHVDNSYGSLNIDIQLL